MDLLADRILQISEMAEAVGVTLAIRPRVGCFVDSISRFERLTQWIGGSPLVRLAADVSTMVAVGEMPVVDGLQRIADMVACVYFSDIRLGEESLDSAEGAWIGGGHVSAVRIVRGLKELRFTGPVILEPSELGRWTPENARKLGEIVFDRVIFTK
jgi:L-ribulose-5-phosphate 3-epimerase UlaE